MFDYQIGDVILQILYICSEVIVHHAVILMVRAWTGLRSHASDMLGGALWSIFLPGIMHQLGLRGALWRIFLPGLINQIDLRGSPV